MTGWVPPSSASPPGDPPTDQPTGWAAPAGDAGIGVGEAIRSGWTLTRQHLAGLAAVAAIPVLIWNALLIPIWLGVADQMERVVRFFTTLDLERYRSDPEALQRDFQAILQPSTQYAVGSALLGGVGIVVAIVGAAAVTSATLDAADGRPVSIGRSFSAVAAHAGAIVGPALVLGLVVGAGAAALNLGQTGVVGVGGTPGRAVITSLATIVGLVLWIALIVLAIRWALTFQAILAEDLGIAAALGRSAALTAGVRVRVGLTIVATAIAAGVVVTLPAVVAGTVVGLLTAAIAPAFVTYAVIATIGSLVIVPVLVSVVTVIYRDRVAATSTNPAS